MNDNKISRKDQKTDAFFSVVNIKDNNYIHQRTPRRMFGDDTDKSIFVPTFSAEDDWGKDTLFKKILRIGFIVTVGIGFFVLAIYLSLKA